MNNLLTIHLVTTNKSKQTTNHTLTVSVHSDVMKNKNRLISHCSSVAKKSYGNKVDVVKITTFDSDVLWEK